MSQCYLIVLKLKIGQLQDKNIVKFEHYLALKWHHFVKTI